MIHFLVPGPLDQVTGGYLFDRRMVEGLRARGREVRVVELVGRFPDADETARRAVADALGALPEGAAAAIDGLALPGASDCLEAEGGRLRLVGFVHHPLALETGLSKAESRAYATLEARLLKLLRGVICPSARTAAELEAYGVPASRVAVVEPGVDRRASSARAREPGTPWRLLCVATLTPRKGHLVLVAALAALRDLDWRLVCVGSLDRDAATVAAVRERAAVSGLDGRIDFVGEWAPERLSEAYEAADVFVLPSFHEGYGMAFAEAMAHGLPVVATRAGAIPQTVPREAGLLVAPGDPDALAAALRRIMADAALHGRLAAGARKAAARLPGWEETAARWEAAFDRLAG